MQLYVISCVFAVSPQIVILNLDDGGVVVMRMGLISVVTETFVV